jgi:hypothetical protein
MNNYNLGFISNEDLFNHVKDTVLKYRFKIDLSKFNKNLIDPIKLTFDSKVYAKSIEEIIDTEIIRQMDKSNTNHIGYFHQNIFKYIGKGWEVPPEGFDVINENKKIYVELKNKHNTMNSSSSQRTYIKMQNTLLENDQATCMLVEVIAKKSQDIPWRIKIDNRKYNHEKIRRVSIDKFYDFVTEEKYSFKLLCETLPKVIDDVITSLEINSLENTVLQELKDISPNILKSLYLLSFKTYEGFEDIDIG